MMFLVMPRPRGPNRWVVAEVYEDGTRQVVERFETEAAAMQHRRDLQDRADRVERAAPPPVPSKPAAPRKPHTGRWVDAPVVALIGALAVAWAMPAAAQRSPLFMCLQLAPAGLSVETMLSECRLEVQDWMNTCSQSRPVEACQQAVAEEANAAAADKGVQRP